MICHKNVNQIITSIDPDVVEWPSSSPAPLVRSPCKKKKQLSVQTTDAFWRSVHMSLNSSSKAIVLIVLLPFCSLVKTLPKKSYFWVSASECDGRTDGPMEVGIIKTHAAVKQKHGITHGLLPWRGYLFLQLAFRLDFVELERSFFDANYWIFLRSIHVTSEARRRRGSNIWRSTFR